MSLGIGKSQFPEMVGVTGMLLAGADGLQANHTWMGGGGSITLRKLHGERFDHKVQSCAILSISV